MHNTKRKLTYQRKRKKEYSEREYQKKQPANKKSRLK